VGPRESLTYAVSAWGMLTARPNFLIEPREIQESRKRERVLLQKVSLVPSSLRGVLSTRCAPAVHSEGGRQLQPLARFSRAICRAEDIYAFDGGAGATGGVGIT
jgi:hypothetical protein